MTTLWETQTLDDLQAEEARKHNAMIRERYRLLQNAEEAQLEKTFAEAEQQKRAEQFTAPAAPVAPVVPAMPEAPAAPVVKTQERAVPLTAQQKDLFTADTFRRVVSGAAECAGSGPSTNSGRASSSSASSRSCTPWASSRISRSRAFRGRVRFCKSASIRSRRGKSHVSHSSPASAGVSSVRSGNSSGASLLSRSRFASGQEADSVTSRNVP